MKDIRLAAAFYSHGGGAVPVNSNGQSWNNDFVTTTGNVVVDLLHNFHLECGARLHKLRVYETLSDPTGREVCGYLLVRGSVHAHAYALALKKITGVTIEKMLPTPNIPLGNIPECQKYLADGSHRRLYTFSPADYAEMAGIWGNGELALPGDPPGELEVVEGVPEGGKIHQLTGVALGLHARLRARGNVRDRREALQGLALRSLLDRVGRRSFLAENRGRGIHSTRRAASGRPVSFGNCATVSRSSPVVRRRLRLMSAIQGGHP